MLDTGYWLLDAGYWMLDAGYWLLDAGYWLTETSCCYLEFSEAKSTEISVFNLEFVF
jgi:hypothetical protein